MYSIEVYRDMYGGKAYLKTWSTGVSRLTCYVYTGVRYHEQEYKSHRGAKIALGRIGDGWRLEKVTKR